MHNEVGRVEAERLSNAKKVSILVDESDLLLARASLYDARCSQDNILGLCEEYHMLLL